MFKRSLTVLLLLAYVALIAACGDDDDETDAATTAPASVTVSASETPAPEPDKVVFMAGFKPQANLPFVGAYVAQEMGYFEEENLEVEIRHSNPGENFRFLASGEVQFSTADASAAGNPWLDTSPIMTPTRSLDSRIR